MGSLLTIEQVLLDGPASKPEAVVPRHSAPLASLSLTPIVIAKLPRSAGTGPTKTLWEKEQVESKWNNSTWAKTRENVVKRRALTDFERFKVMRLRKQVSRYSSPRRTTNLWLGFRQATWTNSITGPLRGPQDFGCRSRHQGIEDDWGSRSLIDICIGSWGSSALSKGRMYSEKSLTGEERNLLCYSCQQNSIDDITFSKIEVRLNHENF